MTTAESGSDRLSVRVVLDTHTTVGELLEFCTSAIRTGADLSDRIGQEFDASGQRAALFVEVTARPMGPPVRTGPYAPVTVAPNPPQEGVAQESRHQSRATRSEAGKGLAKKATDAELIDRVVAHYKESCSLRATAKATRTSVNRIRRLLAEAGVEVSSKPGVRPRRAQASDPPAGRPPDGAVSPLGLLASPEPLPGKNGAKRVRRDRAAKPRGVRPAPSIGEIQRAVRGYMPSADEERRIVAMVGISGVAAAATAFGLSQREIEETVARHRARNMAASRTASAEEAP